MPTVYRVRPDVNKYQYFLTDDKCFKDSHTWDGTSYLQNWAPPEVYVYKPKYKIGDFWGCHFMTGGFALSKKAYQDIFKQLDPSGEVLPLPYEGHDLFIFNATDVVNCLDKKKSVFDPELPSFIDEYSFHAHRFNHSLFKMPETAMGELLTVEGVTDPLDEFKPTVESLNLKGLVFDKIWSDE